MLVVGSLGALALASVVWVALAGLRERSEPVPLRLGRAGQLTSEPGLEVQPSISPDGREVAYAVGTSLQTRIAMKPTSGGRARWLTADSAANEWSPRWSPDGTRILFLSRGGVFSASARGGPAREEITARPDAMVRSATWSADGSAITYVRGDSLLVHGIGSGSTRLIATGADLHSCRGSPDGVWLACVSGNSFYVTVGAVYGIGPMFGNLAPSTIVLVPAAGDRPISVTDSVSLNQSPVWSLDGRKLYFVSNRDGPRDVYALEVRSRGPAGQAPVRVTTGMGVQSLDFSADERQMVYAVYASTANVWAIPIPESPRAEPLQASVASAVPVTSANQTVEGVRVSPDGQWLIYDSDLSGNSDVYRVPATGGDAERLTRGSIDEFRGTVSPSGRELAYHSFPTGSRNIFLLTLADGSVRQLTRSSAQATMANWSPDGHAVSFFNMSTAEVLVTRRDQSGRWDEPRVVARGWRPEWSPDGRTIAFVSPTDGRIGLVSAAGGPARNRYVPAEGDPLAELAVFSANGRQLYFKSHDAYGRAAFWSIPIAGGLPQPLIRFDDPAWASNRFDFASDGKRFYFTVEDRQSDIWLADVLGH
jgi:Tol biopolymer transport system component